MQWDWKLLVGAVVAAVAGGWFFTRTGPEPDVDIEGSDRGSRRPPARSQDLSRQGGQIRRSRTVTRRILHDRRASDEIKRQATELEALLDQREQVIARLEKQQQDFLAQHKSEIDEIEALRR